MLRPLTCYQSHFKYSLDNVRAYTNQTLPEDWRMVTRPSLGGTFVLRQILLCSPHWPGVNCVAQASIKLTVLLSYSTSPTDRTVDTSNMRLDKTNLGSVLQHGPFVIKLPEIHVELYLKYPVV